MAALVTQVMSVRIYKLRAFLANASSVGTSVPWPWRPMLASLAEPQRKAINSRKNMLKTLAIDIASAHGCFGQEHGTMNTLRMQTYVCCPGASETRGA